MELQFISWLSLKLKLALRADLFIDLKFRFQRISPEGVDFVSYTNKRWKSLRMKCLFCLFIDRKEEKADLQRKICLMLVQSPNGHQQPKLSQSKAGTSSGSPTCVQSPEALGHAILLSQASNRNLDGKRSSRETLAPIWDPGAGGRGNGVSHHTKPRISLLYFYISYRFHGVWINLGLQYILSH